MNSGGRVQLSHGDQVAGYVVDSYIARGGMAVVYRARDLGLGRYVALKLIAPELAENDKFRQRFIRESEMAAAIDHPNILPIYQAGEVDGLLYIAMRYVDGSDLGAFMRQHGPLPAQVALPLFTQVAAALDTAHAHGLVHRDVKPGNILIPRVLDDDGDSHAYLTDFGLTKRSASLSGLTTAGHFMGTLSYVAPEQIAGRNIDHRVDVYAMGCVLYEALAGVPPFQRDDDAAMLWAHMSDTAEPLSALRPDLPPQVDAVLAHAMAKSPDDRPASCRTVISELRSAFRSVRRPGLAPTPMPETSTPEMASSSPAAGAPTYHLAPPEPLRSDPPSPVAPFTPSVPSASPSVPPTQSRAGSGANPVVSEPISSAGEGGFAPGDPSGATASTARAPRQGLLLSAVGVVLLLIVALGGYALTHRGGGMGAYAKYIGNSQNADWLSFQQPMDWETHNTVIGVCFCTQHFGPLFETGDPGVWHTVDTTANASPGDVEGMYVTQTPTPLATDADGATSAVQGLLSHDTVTTTMSMAATVDGEQGWRVDGTMVSQDNPDTRLSFNYYLMPAGDQTDNIILFTRADRVAQFQSEAAHVLGSITFTGS